MKKWYRALLCMAVGFLLFSCLSEQEKAEQIVRHLIRKNEKVFHYYYRQEGLAYWEATTHNTTSAYDRLVKLELDFREQKGTHSNKDFLPERMNFVPDKIFTEEHDFQLIKKIRASGLVKDSMLSRQLDGLYHDYMDGLIESGKFNDLVATEVRIYQEHFGFRVQLDGKSYTANQIDSLRRAVNDPDLPRRIFEGRRMLGVRIEADIRRLVSLRNEFARMMGYANYYELSLEKEDENVDQVFEILHETERRTRDRYFEAKREIDRMIAKRYGIDTSEIMPWHYFDDQFSLHPVDFSSQLDKLVNGSNVVEIARTYFNQAGLSVDQVLDRSDLSARKGKAQGAYLIPVDRDDIRLVGDIQNNFQGLESIMRLCGFASTYVYVSDKTPLLLYDPHYMISAGVGLLCKDLTTNIAWLQSVVNIAPGDMAKYKLLVNHASQIDKLFKCRELVVKAEFERALYENPDQDLSKLWWKLNQQYLGVKIPAYISKYDWASIRVTSLLTCNSQNQLLADIFAQQLRHALQKRFPEKITNACCWASNPQLGTFLRKNLFRYGNYLTWNELIKRATGEELTPDYYVEYLLTDDI